MSAKVCGVGPCTAPRVDGSDYCASHGPRTGDRKPRPGKGTVQPLSSSLNAQIICPQCQVRGQVRTKRVKRKQGISGGKATGAVLTAGFSLFATGLSRKQLVTEARCGNCGSNWTIA